MNLTKIENTTPVRDFPEIYNGNIDALDHEIKRLNDVITTKDEEIRKLKETFNKALGNIKAECLAMFDRYIQDNICNQVYVIPVINPDTLVYEDSAKLLVISTSSYGTTEFYLGYKKDSPATSDSQITWGEANVTALTAIDAGIYYIYYKYIADDNHCGNKTYTNIGTKEIERGTGIVDSGSAAPN